MVFLTRYSDVFFGCVFFPAASTSYSDERDSFLLYGLTINQVSNLRVIFVNLVGNLSFFKGTHSILFFYFPSS